MLNTETFSIEESSSAEFECNKWLEIILKGPFKSKFNDCEYTIENWEENSKNGLNGGAIASIIIKKRKTRPIQNKKAEMEKFILYNYWQINKKKNTYFVLLIV